MALFFRHALCGCEGFRYPSPCSKSAIISSTSSNPTDNRTSPSVTPCDKRASRESTTCDVEAGCEINVRASPKLVASAHNFTEFIKRAPAWTPPFKSNQTIPPKPFICLFASACCGCDSKPGYATDFTWGCCSKNFATANAFALCRATRRGNVVIPRKIKYALNGLSTPPK